VTLFSHEAMSEREPHAIMMMGNIYVALYPSFFVEPYALSRIKT